MKYINDILKTKDYSLLSVTPVSTISHAAMQMANRQLVELPVVEEGKLVGTISEQECIHHLILNGDSTNKKQVREIMEPAIFYATPSQTIDRCLEIMNEEHILHLSVVENGSFVGSVSMSDVLRTIINDQKDSISKLENYIMGIPDWPFQWAGN